MDAKPAIAVQGSGRIFAEAFQGLQGVVPLVSEPPRMVEGNLIVKIDEEECVKGLHEQTFSLIGRLVLVKGDQPIKLGDLKSKLSAIWGVSSSSWSLIPWGKVY